MTLSGRAYARTPIGNFQGSLCGMSASELGGIAIKAAVERAGLTEKPEIIDEVIMGNVLSAGLGQAPATTAAHLGGIPSCVPSSTVNKVCASGMKAIMLAANAIKTGQADIVVAGGMESMSRAPYLLPVMARSGGMRYGDQSVLDSLRFDGLTDATTGTAMGLCGEKCAEDYGISRDESDLYAKRSYERAIQAQNEKLFSSEIVPITITKPKGSSSIVVESDEGTRNVIPALSDGN